MDMNRNRHDFVNSRSILITLEISKLEKKTVPLGSDDRRGELPRDC